MRLDKQMTFLIEEIQYHSNNVKDHMTNEYIDMADKLDLHVSLTHMEKEIENLNRLIIRAKERFCA